jgi:hypothetical protein
MYIVSREDVMEARARPRDRVFKSQGGRDTPGDSCICHGTPFSQLEFRDSTSLREFISSRLCQQTQDNLFNPEDM